MISSHKIHAQRPIVKVGEAPEKGYLKFNVDVVVVGSYEDAGIGGLLRDETGKICILFSKSIDVTDPASAELRSVMETCALFFTSRWRRSHSLIIETDSLLTTK
ncbi:hypothetical protein V6N11_008134 [Hibiscus sabdariffa]|uniref:RNase H type-1 domain-containing protein n=1 Tax=Hibiscus sabdariffa TaxID=183260 RepID=A0ABR2PZQ5_9ROSI